MQKYFLTKNEFDSLVIENDFHHIHHVMRMKENDKFIVCFNNISYLVSVTSVNEHNLNFKIEKEIEEDNELPVQVDLIQGYAKGEKMDYIVQKATELGVGGIYPVVMKRSIVQVSNDKKDNKRMRLSKIALEAARQSHRARTVEIYDKWSLKDIDYSEYDYVLVAYEELARDKETSVFKDIIKKIKVCDKILLVVGPEGGIDDQEISFLQAKGAFCCGLGPRILRTETASLYMLSCISYELELGK